MKNTLRIALTTALLWSTASQAEIFAGFGVGQASIDDTANAVSLDDNATAWKVYGGMMITENFGFEAGWTDMGDMTDTGADVETEAFVASGIAALPITETFSIYGKLGVAFWDQDINTTNYDGTDLTYGVGAKLIFMEQFHARLEWEQINADLEANVVNASVGIVF